MLEDKVGYRGGWCNAAALSPSLKELRPAKEYDSKVECVFAKLEVRLEDVTDILVRYS